MEQQTVEKQEAAIDVMETLFPAAATHTLEDGTVVVLSKIKMKHNAYVARLLVKIVDALGLDSKGNITIPLGNQIELLRLIAKFPEDINEMLSVFTNLSLDQVEELDIAEGAVLFKKVVEVNRSFFIEKVAPLMGRLPASAGGLAEEEKRVKRTRKS